MDDHTNTNTQNNYKNNRFSMANTTFVLKMEHVAIALACILSALAYYVYIDFTTPLSVKVQSLAKKQAQEWQDIQKIQNIVNQK